jgi:hypothetical protein
MNETTQKGIAALKAGDRAAAKQLLGSAVKQDPNDLLAWLWLSGAVDRDEERLTCLQQVLRIDPGNQAAARGLSQVMAKQTAQPAPAPANQEPSAQGISETQAVEPSEPHAISMQPPPDQSVLSVATTAVISPRENTAPSIRNRFFTRRAVDVNRGQIIFRTRPSVVPALLCFWLFLFGTIAIAMLMGSASFEAYLLPVGLGVILEFTVLFVVLHNLRTHYILSSESLSLPFRRVKADVALDDITGAEVQQSPFQKMIGIGNLDIDGIFNNELVHLRMRDIPDIKRRSSQLKELLGNQE